MTRGIAADLNGRIFGALTIKARAGRDKSNHALWECECKCGNVVSVRAPLLKRGQMFCSKQCPEFQAYFRVDITGQRFGRMVALNFTGKMDRSRKAIWKFKCDCGNESETTADRAIQKIAQSCGCFEIENRITHGLSKTIEYHREAHRRWAKENPAKVIANAFKRRKDYYKRVPPWLTDEHWKQISAFYVEARRLTEETGIVHHVDHIHPLRGKTVSGLHVPWNLQILTAADNMKKSARLIDDVC